MRPPFRFLAGTALLILSVFVSPASRATDTPEFATTLKKMLGTTAASQETTIKDDFATILEFPREGDDWRTFVLEVDDRVESVHLWTTNATGNIDLYVRYGAEMTHYSQADFRADHSRSNEDLWLRRDDAPTLRSGTYYVDVTRTEPLERRTRFFVQFKRRDAPFADEALARPEVTDDAEIAATVKEDSRFTIPFWFGDNSWRTVAIEVPKRTRGLDILALGAQDDLDLYLSTDGPLHDWEADAEYTAATDSWNERIVATSERKYLEAGTYYLDIINFAEDPDFGPVELTVRYHLPADDSPAPMIVGPVKPIEPGIREHYTVNLERRPGASFRFEVPPDTRSIHARLYNATRDLALFLRHGQRVTDFYDESGYDFQSSLARLDESLDAKASPGKPLQPGTWYLDVGSLVDYDLSVDFDLLVTLDQPPPRHPEEYLRALPSQDNPAYSPLEAALLACAEITVDYAGGSATCLSPDGVLLTNYHVLENEGTIQMDHIYVSFPLALDDVPAQMFRAEVLEADKYLDLALLRISGDLDGDPLPAGYRFPFVKIGDSDASRLGDDVWVAGYPAVGGEESRISLSIMRGVVTGFQKEPSGENLWIKTDARVNNGNSGGALFRSDTLELIGIPSQTVYDDLGELGYCRPTSRIPEAWRKYF